MLARAELNASKKRLVKFIYCNMLMVILMGKNFIDERRTEGPRKNESFIPNLVNVRTGDKTKTCGHSIYTVRFRQERIEKS